MPDRRKSRIRAYRFIVEKAKKVNRGLTCESVKALADVNHIAPGAVDSLPELVAAVKKLLCPVVSETERVFMQLE